MELISIPAVRAMVLERAGAELVLRRLQRPVAGPGQVLIAVEACGVCRTDLHVVDGELKQPKLPLIPGHEIVGRVVELGQGSARFAVGARVGVPWLGWACGQCGYCRSGRENLCDRARFTGYTLDGGYAEYVAADERFCLELPDGYEAVELAPLMCAGLIGYRALRKTGAARRVGLYGFGAAAHLITQVARLEGREVYAFTRPGDTRGQAFAQDLGAVWAGGSEARPSVELEAAIIFAPVGQLVPTALRAVGKGGVVVCAGIHMSDIPQFPYELLWGERSVVSVANLTRADGNEFMRLASRVRVQARVELFELEEANAALDGVRGGRVKGAAVLRVKT